jgi:hypothetical protein
MILVNTLLTDASVVEYHQGIHVVKPFDPEPAFLRFPIFEDDLNVTSFEPEQSQPKDRQERTGGASMNATRGSTHSGEKFVR